MQIPEVLFNQGKMASASFELVDLESLYNRNIEQNPEHPHRLTFFLLVYIEAGDGQHMVDFETYDFSAGSIIFVQREQVHAFDFSGKPKGKVLLFTQDFLDQVHANMRLPNYTPTHLNRFHSPIVQLDDANNQRCQNLLEEITFEIEHPNIDPLIVMYLFSSLSLVLHRLRPETRQDKLSKQQSAKFALFIELLFNHFSHVRDANWYAKKIGTTYKTLNQVCKLATELTAKQVIDAYTILEIKRQLVVSSITTQQIAYDYGFEDASNFVKYFKKNTQFTPSQFQQKYTTPKL